MTRLRRLAGLAAAALTTVGLAGAVAVTGTAGTAAAQPAPAPVAAAPVAAPSATPCVPAARACIDLSARRAWLTDGAGHVTYGPVPARGGRADEPTPVGIHHVLWKDADHLSRQFNNAPMPFSVFFASGVATHGGSTSVTSNGCVHLATQAAQRFYDDLQDGDTVQVVP